MCSDPTFMVFCFNSRRLIFFTVDTVPCHFNLNSFFDLTGHVVFFKQYQYQYIYILYVYIYIYIVLFFKKDLVYHSSV